MTIYIDVVLILNFVIDMLLIIGVDMLLKRHTKFRKIVISSLLVVYLLCYCLLLREVYGCLCISLL